MNEDRFSYIHILTTTETSEQAHAIAAALVEGRLAACVQVIGPISSTYRWKDNVDKAEEWQCAIKTTAANYAAVEAKIRELHSYETPEIIAVPIIAGSADYLAWIAENTTQRE